MMSTRKIAAVMALAAQGTEALMLRRAAEADTPRLTAAEAYARAIKSMMNPSRRAAELQLRLTDKEATRQREIAIIINRKRLDDYNIKESDANFMPTRGMISWQGARERAIKEATAAIKAEPVDDKTYKEIMACLTEGEKAKLERTRFAAAEEEEKDGLKDGDGC